MSAGQSRIELFVDVLAEKNQRALVLPNVTVTELVEEILQEFRTLDHLSDLADDYQLLKVRDRSLLDPSAQIGKQLANHDHLVLVEHEPPLPEKTRRPTKHLYLRDADTGKVYKLHWQPAIIGRPENTQQQKSVISVDLTGHERALRVSRQHAQISEENGQYYIQRLSQNPTTIKDEQGATIVLDMEKRPLQPGQIIYLDNSRIALTFLVREKERIP
ncbi:MAG: FHA domain-containing protein [Chloroflexales bacterium]|nr:FHA domain-containing protein [Chloroflexales bacterium]